MLIFPKQQAPVILSARRTPIAKFKGAYLGVRADELPEALLREAWQGLPDEARPALAEVVLGCANQAGEDCRNVARQSSLLAGLPASVPALTLNRLCGSGLSAVAYAMQGVASGMGKLYFVGGLEQMSRSPLAYLPPHVEADAVLEDTTFGWRFSNPRFEGLGYKVNHTQEAEGLAKERGITRHQQDAYALASHQKACQAWQRGDFNAECLPLESLVLLQDETPRANLSTSALARLKPLQEGRIEQATITAATASPFSDGACLLTVASAAWAKEQHWPTLARLRGFAMIATAPQEQGMAGVLSAQALLKAHGLNAAQLDALEWHDNFAATSLASMQALQLDPQTPNWNTWGGALALGAPMGMASARLVVTLVHRLQALKRAGQLQSGLGLAALSIGMGQGMALLVEVV
jgi:acetyl-CoA acyltransferase